MKRWLISLTALILILSGLIIGARLIGQHLVEWPISVSQRQPMPDQPPFADLLPELISAFQREQFSLPIEAVSGNARMTAAGSAEYRRPGDPNRVYIEVNQFASPAIAALLIDPANWRLQSATSSKYYSLKPPTPFVLTATDNGYQDYQLEYVNGRWNVKIDSADDQTLRAFAAAYPH